MKHMELIIILRFEIRVEEMIHQDELACVKVTWRSSVLSTKSSMSSGWLGKTKQTKTTQGKQEVDTIAS